MTSVLDRNDASRLLREFADFLEQGLPYPAAFLGAAVRTQLETDATLSFMSDQFSAGPVACSALLETLIDRDLVDVVRRGERLAAVIVYLRLASSIAAGENFFDDMAAAANPARVRALMENLADAVADGFAVPEAFTMAATDAGFDIAAIYGHVNQRVVDGQSTCSRLLEGLVTDETLAVVELGEAAGDMIGYLRKAATTVNAGR